jgi:putative transposase
MSCASARCGWSSSTATSTAPSGRRVGSVGSKGDSYDNALVESFNGLYRWKLIYPQGPWHGLSDVEFAALTYVDWFNHRQLHGEITTGPGYKAEYRQPTTPAETQTPECL